MFESAVNAVYWFRKSKVSSRNVLSSSLTSNSLLLHLQVRSGLVDGSPANRVSLAATVSGLEHVIDKQKIVAPRSSSVPSSSQSSPASSPRAALLLQTFALRLTRRPSLTPCKALRLAFENIPWKMPNEALRCPFPRAGCFNQHLGTAAAVGRMCSSVVERRGSASLQCMIQPSC